MRLKFKMAMVYRIILNTTIESNSYMIGCPIYYSNSYISHILYILILNIDKDHNIASHT